MPRGPRDPGAMTDTSTEVTTVVDDYLAAWNERDEQRRAQLIERAWAPDGRLVDPPFDGDGHDGISQMAAVMHEHYDGHRFERAAAWTCTTSTCGSPGRLVGPDGYGRPSRGIDVADWRRMAGSPASSGSSATFRRADRASVSRM